MYVINLIIRLYSSVQYRFSWKSGGAPPSIELYSGTTLYTGARQQGEGCTAGEGGGGGGSALQGSCGGPWGCPPQQHFFSCAQARILYCTAFARFGYPCFGSPFYAKLVHSITHLPSFYPFLVKYEVTTSHVAASGSRGWKTRIFLPDVQSTAQRSQAGRFPL